MGWLLRTSESSAAEGVGVDLNKEELTDSRDEPGHGIRKAASKRGLAGTRWAEQADDPVERQRSVLDSLAKNECHRCLSCEAFFGIGGEDHCLPISSC